LQTDKDKRQLWQAMLDKMPAYSIDAQGELDEWLWQGVKNNNHHRHASHLYALYDEVSPEFMADTLLQNAVKNTIEQRLDFRRKEGGGEMAFGLVHLGAAAAHIDDTAHATEILNYLCSNYWSNGLMTYHNVGGLFNADISGGLPFLITQMLLYSSSGLIKILPALPAAWPSGTITGLLLRGNIRLHTMSWDAAGVSLLLQAGHTQKITCRLPRVFQSAELDGKKITLPKNARNIEVNLAAGKATSITIHY
jgi:alpha-L-fucosidase 2